MMGRFAAAPLLSVRCNAEEIAVMPLRSAWLALFALVLIPSARS
jgi:hypothetical protein